MFYPIKKFLDYYIKKIDVNLENKAMELLNDKEIEIYKNMDYYDRYHGLEVYSKMLNYTNDKIYLKLSILHDCGKSNASFWLRVLHKLGFKTKLQNHAKEGYILLKNIDENLANLVLKHHDKNQEGLFKKFQEMDDRS